MPLAFTFVCVTEINAFSSKAAEFRKAGCELVGMSVDSHFTLLQWMQTKKEDGGIEGCDFPVLSDLSKQMARDYGVLATPDDGATLRGSIIVSDTGVVRHVTINDRPVGRSVDEALRLVKAFKHVDALEAKGVEGVCGAGWIEGAPTIKPDPKGKLEFFKNEYGGESQATKKTKH